jgi:hypothetical protein
MLCFKCCANITGITIIYEINNALFCNFVPVQVSGLKASSCYNAISTQNMFAFEEPSLGKLEILQNIVT